MAENVYLVVTSAFVLAGDIVKAGELVEVTDSEARDLLGRGMARVATEEDGAPAVAVPDESDTAQPDPDDDAGDDK